MSFYQDDLYSVLYLKYRFLLMERLNIDLAGFLPIKLQEYVLKFGFDIYQNFEGFVMKYCKIMIFLVLFLSSCSNQFRKFESIYYENANVLEELVLFVLSSDFEYDTINQFNEILDKDISYKNKKEELKILYVENRDDSIFFIFGGNAPDTVYGISYIDEDSTPFISKNDILKRIKGNWYYFLDV